MNKIIISGNLTKDPDLRYTSQNTAYAKFSVAVSRPFSKDKRQPDADFFDVTVWGRQAEFVGKYFQKGSRILIEGRLQNNNYTDKNGVKHYSNSIVADNVEFAGGKSQNGKQDNPDDYEPPEDEVDMPF